MCDERCRSALGNVCTCQECHGRNHGSEWREGPDIDGVRYLKPRKKIDRETLELFDSAAVAVVN